MKDCPAVVVYRLCFPRRKLKDTGYDSHVVNQQTFSSHSIFFPLKRCGTKKVDSIHPAVDKASTLSPSNIIFNSALKVTPVLQGHGQFFSVLLTIFFWLTNWYAGLPALHLLDFYSI